MSGKLRLTLTKTRFVASVGELDRPPEQLVLVVRGEVFDKAVSLAEAVGFRIPGRRLKCRSLDRAATAMLAQHLRRSLAEPEQVADAKSRFSVTGSLRAFFTQKPNYRQLMAILDLLENGGELVLEEEPEQPPPIEVHRGSRFEGRAARRSGL